MYDIIVVGAGPAGLTAALYAVRAGKSVLLLEKANYGGQMAFSPKIENFPSYKEIGGYDLSESIYEQVITAGVRYCEESVCKITDIGGIKEVRTEEGAYSAKAVILATGTRHRTLGAKNEKDYSGNGISYCAACDGAFLRIKALRSLAEVTPRCRRRCISATFAKASLFCKICPSSQQNRGFASG